MYRFIIISSFLFLFMLNCQKENSMEPFDYERDTPTWLKAKIDSISSNPEYFGTKVYRYEWKGYLVYHIEIPISSCAYCELYDQKGKKLKLMMT